MAIYVQTPTGVRFMELDELLREDINLNAIQGTEGFIDPMNLKVPHVRDVPLDFDVRDVTLDFDLPDISEIEEIDPRTYRRKGKKRN